VDQLNYSIKQRVLFSLILIVGIISNFSGTGSVALVFILLSSFGVSVFIRKKIYTLKSIKNLFYIIILILIILIPVIKTSNNDIIKNGSRLLEAKYQNIIGDEDAYSNTMDIRQQQAEYNQKKYSYNTIRKLFGLSLNAFTRDASIANKYLYCENMYEILKIATGYVGLFLFLLVNVKFLHMVFKTANRFSFCIVLIIVVVYLLGNYTTCTYIMIPNIGYYAILMSYFLRERYLCASPSTAVSPKRAALELT
ncbi:MAG: hypothetical protein K6F33_14275, partial [Bacteroidales bacterium]|nr:hypothetical protein [Bacteroidales bacterium]